MAGVSSNVCTRLGFIASLSNAVIAPSAPKSNTVTGSPDFVYATRIFETRRCKSLKSLARQRIAIISVATVISKPSLRGVPFTEPPSPISISRNARSFKSKARFQIMRLGSISNSFP